MAFQKLYPPYIEGKLPAQIGDVLRIPYQLNRAQGVSDVAGKKIIARLKMATSNQVAANKDLECTFINNAVNNIFTAEFDLTAANITLDIGQFYKIQLAFEDGYFSTVGIFKYTAQPNVFIEGLSTDGANAANQKFIGRYSSELDPTEKQYSYCFNLYDLEGNLIESSGEQYHDHKTEEPDSFIIYTALNSEKRYWLNYTVKTTNSLVVQSMNYMIERTVIPLGSQINLADKGFSAIGNYEKGSIVVSISLANDSQCIQGTFEILRADNKSDFTIWTPVKKIILNKDFEANEKIALFEDFTVEHGVSYQYALQQKANNIFTEQILSSKVLVDFEDMFLYDGERQVNLKFDPKVSSFKTTILSSKIETLGGKYPAFYRNMSVGYKSFPIAGLISRLAELEENQEVRQSTQSVDTTDVGFKTNLTSDNIFNERQYKLNLLDWLNNNKPKLFRSPTEGNYLVRISDISLTPNDTLGRMLHSFSCQANEMDNNDYKTLKKYGFYQDDLETYNEILENSKEPHNFSTENVLEIPSGITKAIIRKANMHQEVKLLFANGVTQNIIIGSTNYYNFYIEKDNPLIRIESKSGLLDYVYRKADDYSISGIQNAIKHDKIVQIIGHDTDVTDPNTIHSIPNSKYIRIQSKEFIQVYEKEGKYYWNEQNVNPIDDATLLLSGQTFWLYYIDELGKKNFYDPNSEAKWTRNIQFEYHLGGTIYWPDISLEKIDDESYTGIFIEYNKENLKGIDEITLFNGLYADIYYTDIEVQ